MNGSHSWAAALLALAPAAGWATELCRVQGVVHDAVHRPVAAAAVQLQAAHSAWSETTRSDAAGRFAFAGVPIGDYLLEVSSSGYASATLALTVESGAAPSTHVQLASGPGLQTVTVNAAAPANAASFTPMALVDAHDISVTPGADRSNSLAMITDFVPGAYLVHDQLHVRGGHQVTWEVDGVEIPNTNVGSNLGPQIDPKDIDYLEVERGGYAADEGDRTYGVFNVVPRTGFAGTDQGELTLSGGSFGQTNDALSVGSHTDSFAYYASVAGDRSGLGLMTPVARVIHDDEDGYGAFTTLIYNATREDQLRLIAAARADSYQIPNTPGEPADDVQREADAFGVLSWMRTFSSELTLTSSVFYHYNRADFDGGAEDFPISTTYQRASSYLGAEESLHFAAGRNDLTAGLYGFSQSDNESFHVLFNDGSGAPLLGSLRPSGSLDAAYFQDSYRLGQWLTLSAGVRQTHFTGLPSENATDPRLGGTVKLAGLKWVLRGFYGKYYQAPPLETVSGPLLKFAQRNGLAFLPLHGERDTEWQAGLTVPVHGWSVDLDHFRTAARNFFDHNPIGNSDVFLPITISGALIEATELMVRSPRFWSTARVHLAWSNQSADGFGALTGGLTNFTPPAGYYALDHDQRNTVNVGGSLKLPHGLCVAANLYYGSGFANGNPPPSHLSGHASLDLTLGRQFTRRLSAALTVLNVTDRHLLVDDSLTFGGLHYDYPREIYAGLHYRFGY